MFMMLIFAATRATGGCLSPQDLKENLPPMDPFGKRCIIVVIIISNLGGGTYLTEINFIKFFRQFHMVIYVG